MAGDLRAHSVGSVLARPRNGELHEHGREGCENDGQDVGDQAGLVVAVATEQKTEVREHSKRAGKCRRDRHDQRVTVPDV
jgi:hypothetical protein